MWGRRESSWKTQLDCNSEATEAKEGVYKKSHQEGKCSPVQVVLDLKAFV